MHPETEEQTEIEITEDTETDPDEIFITDEDTDDPDLEEDISEDMDEDFSSDEITAEFSLDEILTSGDYTYTIGYENVCLQKYTGSATNLTLPSSLGGYPVTEIASGFLTDNNTVRSLTVPNSITGGGVNVGSSAFIGWITGAPFMGCESLESIIFEEGRDRIPSYFCAKIPNLKSVTIPSSVKAIGLMAFAGCESLAGVELPMDTIELGGSAFSGTAISVLALPENVTVKTTTNNQITYYPLSGSQISTVILKSGMKTIPEYLFADAPVLKYVSIPGTVTEIGVGAFYWCKELEEFDWPTNVKNIYGSTFKGCEKLKRINLPRKLEGIGDYAFEGCTALEDIEIPDNVTWMGSSIFNGTGVTEVTIPRSLKTADSPFFLSSVKYITFKDGMESIPEGICYWDKELISVSMPDTVKTIGKQAFYGCLALKELRLSTGLTSIGQEFIARTAVSEILIPAKVTEAEYALKGAENLQTVKFAYGIKTIPARICEDNSGLNIVDVTIPDTVQIIGKNAFYECKYIQNIKLPDSLRRIEYGAFSNCSSLSELVLPEGVAELGGYIIIGTQIKEITVPSSLSKVLDDVGPFGGNNIEKIVFSEGMTEVPDRTCANATELTTVVLPESITTIGKNAFYKCTRLKELALPESVTELGQGFIDGTAIEELIIPKNVSVIECPGESGSLIIGAFTGADNLKSIILEEGIEKIQEYVFAGSVIESITIPDSVNEIGKYAFRQCSKLKTINGSVPDQLGEDAFSYCSSLEELVIRKTKDVFLNATDMEAKDGESEDPEVHKLDISWNMSIGTTRKPGDFCFVGCNMKKLTLPASIGVPNVLAFYGIDEIVYTGTEEMWKTYVTDFEYNKKYTKNLLMTITPTCTGEDTLSVPTGFEIQISTSKSFDKCQKVRVSYQDAYTSKTDAFETVVTTDEKVKDYYVRVRSFRGAGKNEDGNSIIRYGDWTDTVSCQVKNIVGAKDVKESVEKFYATLENYLADLKKESEAEEENYTSTETKGTALKNADDGSMVAWLDTSLNDTKKLAVYEALAEYMDKASGMSLGKLPTDPSKASQQIIKAVYENLIANSGEKAYTISGVKVVLNLTGMTISEKKDPLTGKTSTKSGFSGVAKINGKIVATVNSGNSGKVMLAYVKDLRETVNDLMYQSLTSVFSEFKEVTLISQFEKDSTKEWLDNMSSDVENALNKNVGWGKVKKVLTAGWNGCKILKKIKSTSKPADLKEALKSADEIYKYIDKLDMSDSAIKSDLLKSATAELENQRKDLAKTLYCYIYKLEKEDASSTTGKIVQKIRKLKVNCPVDVDIYDSTGELVGSVKNGRASYKPGITLQLLGDTKEFWLSSEKDYQIVFTGTDEGEMSYYMQQREDHKFGNLIAFNSVFLTDGIEYKQTIKAGDISAGQPALILVNTATGSEKYAWTIGADEPKVKVTCTVTEGGKVSGDLEPVEGAIEQTLESTVDKGTRLYLKAEPEEGYEFAGWYQRGKLVSESEEWYFTAVYSTLELEAKFEKTEIFDNGDHALMTGADYNNRLWADICRTKDEITGDTRSDLQISFMEKDHYQTYAIDAVLRRYPKADGDPIEENVALVRKSDGTYLLRDFDPGDDEKIELVDEDGKILVTVYGKNKAPSFECGDGNHNFGDWKVIKEATVLEEGLKERFCINCGAREEAVVEKLSPSDNKPSGGNATPGGNNPSGSNASSGSNTSSGSNISSGGTTASTGKLNMTVIPLKVKQSTTVVKVTGLSKGDYVKSYKTANRKIATVNGKGKITAKKKGNTYLIVILASGRVLKAKIKVQKSKVKTQKLTVNSKKVNLKKKKSFRLKVVKTPLTSLEKVTYTSSNKKVATVSKNGKITAKKAGKAKITVKAGNKKVTVTVVVK